MNKPLFPDVIVNGEVIAHTAIAAETQNHSGPKGKPGIVWRKAANALVIRALLLQEAARLQIAGVPAALAPGRIETPPDATIRALLEEAIDVVPPSEADLRAIYDSNPARFRAPPLWEVSHILCACDVAVSEARVAAEARAGALLAMAQDGATRFARLAAEHSDCESKSNGGTLGQIGPGDTAPAFEAAVAALAVGEISGAPVLTPFGYHIIRLDAADTGRVLPFDTVRGRLRDALEQRAWAKEARAFTDRLVAQAEISGADLAG